MIDDVVRDEGGADIFHCRFDVDRRPDRPGALSTAGRLAFRDGEIVSGDRVVLTHADLVRAARRHPNVFGDDRSIRAPSSRVDDLASFGVRNPVVAMTISALTSSPSSCSRSSTETASAQSPRAPWPYRHLFVSNDGALIGAEDGTVITRTGRTIDPPQGLPASRAIAFSPDDRWLVRVERHEHLPRRTLRTATGPPRIIRLPIPARDLAWEPITSGTSVGPPIRR